ncbi:MAG TPA: helix-turn-helix transcriptional regulator [Bryobacteraceae bacterium]|nr:helix-turn-helix transcriptional regulator [Bryobacteraceae bacterium]
MLNFVTVLRVLPGGALLLKHSEDSRIQKVLALIADAPVQECAGLAGQVHLSTNRLVHLFRHETGVGLGLVLRDARLRYSAHLLSSGKEPEKEIAFLSGYRHLSSFVRAFTLRYFESPRSYRRNPLVLVMSPLGEGVVAEALAVAAHA